MLEPLVVQSEFNRCWQQIGVWGNRTCAELKIVIHCHNCPIFSSAGQQLLEREPPAGYLEEWTELYAQQKDFSEVRQNAPAGTLSINVFRLGNEWLALPAYLFQEVTQLSSVHSIPHRTNKVLLGLVNIRGEVQLCISLMAFLRLEATELKLWNEEGNVIYKRMVVVEKEGNRWVFPVDEIYGTHRIHPDEFLNVPATVSNIPDNYTKALINWQGRKVIYLDDELLFYALSRKLL